MKRAHEVAQSRTERALERTMTTVDTALAKAGSRYPSKALDRAFRRAAACAAT